MDEGESDDDDTLDLSALSESELCEEIAARNKRISAITEELDADKLDGRPMGHMARTVLSHERGVLRTQRKVLVLAQLELRTRKAAESEERIRAMVAASSRRRA